LKKLLVTGGCGFIGSSLVKKALSSGYNVLNIDALTYAGNEDSLRDVASHEHYSFRKIDIRNRKGLEDEISEFSPDGIIHLAAESHVDKSIESPSDFIETNVMGTFNLLHAAWKYCNQSEKKETFRFHHVSTDEVFGSLGLEAAPFHEQSRYDPSSPYSASKAASDHLVRAWNRTYGMNAIITNCSNNFGPFQYPEKLIPLTIINALRFQPIRVYGDGKNIRDWLYVDDHASALLLAYEKADTGSCYNIGSQNELENVFIVNMICEILDQKLPNEMPRADLIQYVSDRPGHDRRYAIDPSLIYKDLGWQAEGDFAERLALTVDWYLESEWWWGPLMEH
jgi:dTDP-glucose 4,6-dehydratase